MKKLKSGIYRFPSRQHVLLMRSECDVVSIPKMFVTDNGGSVMEHEHHQHYKAKWEESTMALAHLTQEPVAETLDGVCEQLAHVLKRGTYRQAARAIVYAAKAVWAHCELHENEA